jgi:uncharacterized protein (TIGR00251 family)
MNSQSRDKKKQLNTDSHSTTNPDNDICQETPDGLIITIEVSAGSKKEIFPDGYNPWRKAFKISVKAPPVEGKANKAIIELIAARFSLPVQAVTILSGQTSSVKRVRIQGISRQHLTDLTGDR